LVQNVAFFFQKVYTTLMTPEIAVGKILRKKKLTLAVAESCTGGLVSSRITDVSGSSRYFVVGIIAYADRVKEKALGVPHALIKKHGAVSAEVALGMAKGIRNLTGVDIGISTTGIAGPTGGSMKKPVGLVYIAFASKKKQLVKEFHFKGSRKNIKFKASEAALKLICEHS
jgi:PncC family amidohydrolase